MITEPRTAKVLPWSWSSLESFETCPRKHWFTRITKKTPEVFNKKKLDGRDIHKSMELYVAGKEAMPEEFAPMLPLADKLRAAPGQRMVEHAFGFTQALAPVDYWDRSAWGRGKIDFVQVRPKVAVVLDFKSGKRKVNSEQLKLFALAAMVTWPHVETVKTGYVWLPNAELNRVQPVLDQEVYTQADKTGILQNFSARVRKMEQAEIHNQWPPRPSGLCRQWCPVGRQNCEHCGS